MFDENVTCYVRACMCGRHVSSESIFLNCLQARGPGSGLEPLVSARDRIDLKLFERQIFTDQFFIAKQLDHTTFELRNFTFDTIVCCYS